MSRHRNPVNEQQRDYILDREAVQEMRNRARRIAWQSIDNNQDNAERLRWNLIAAIDQVAFEMRRNEGRML